MTEIHTGPSTARAARPYHIWMMPHRIVLAIIFFLLLTLAVTQMRWDWIPQFQGQLLAGIGRTLALLVTTASVGMILAILFGVAQVAAPKPVSWLAFSFCGIIRGTPLLLQLWLLYYGVGSLLAQYPEVRSSFLWPYLRQAWSYAFLSLTFSFAAYEGEVMRGAFAGVPRGELEAAKAYGMSRWTLFRRIWLPRALHRALPTLAGDTVLLMKSTPLVATITVVDVYGVISKVRQATYLTYEPLLLLALVYMMLTAVIVFAFRHLENKVPEKT
jgi:polar amino acid transport system permease protein